MNARIESAQGDRCLVKVLFDPNPEDTDSVSYEAVYEVERPAEEDFTIDGDPHFIQRLSCTRTDTREAVHLDKDTEKKIKQAVIAKVTSSEVWGT